MAAEKKNTSAVQNPATKKTTALKSAAKTNAAADPAKRGRGRPPLPDGQALNNAQRKNLQRERDLKRGIADLSVDGLLKSAGASIAAGNIEELRALNSEMVRRAKLNSKKQH